MNSKINSAFTLIEILVVVAIIAMLMGISLFGIQGARENARDARRLSDLEAIRSALELFKAQNGYYPTTVVESPPCGGGWECSIGSHWIQNLPATYIENMPRDPINSAPYYYMYAPCNASGAIQTNYKLIARLENQTNAQACTGCSGTQGGGAFVCLTSP